MTNLKVWLEYDGILRIDYGFHGHITLPTIRHAYQKHVHISTTKRPVMVLGHRMLSVDSAAARFASSQEVKTVTSAMAIITRTALEKHLAKMFLWYQKPPYPTKAFTSQSEAVNWLKTFLDEPEDGDKPPSDEIHH